MPLLLPEWLLIPCAHTPWLASDLLPFQKSTVVVFCMFFSIVVVLDLFPEHAIDNKDAEIINMGSKRTVFFMIVSLVMEFSLKSPFTPKSLPWGGRSEKR
jgi:hypothetical protein